MKIKEISIENRPRERLFRNGVKSLSDAELLAIILRTGTCKENVIDMCNRLISKYDLDKLSSLSLKELDNVKGIGKAKACQILALFELNKRHNINKQFGKPLTCAEEVKNYATSRLPSNDKEYFMIIMLDSKNRVIKDEIISVGTLNSSLVHPREVFKSAIRESANAIILVHNHPSGDLTPSNEDLELTNKLKEAGELLMIKVLDHVIV